MIVSPLLQILAIYSATSLAAGLPLGVALGAMLRRAELRHRQHVAQLMRSRMPDYKDRTRKVIDDARAAEAGPPAQVWMSDRSCQEMHL